VGRRCEGRGPGFDFAAAAFGADQPLAPIEQGPFGAITSSHLGGIGLDLMLAILAPAAALPSVTGRTRPARLLMGLFSLLAYAIYHSSEAIAVCYYGSVHVVDDLLCLRVMDEGVGRRLPPRKFRLMGLL